MERNHLHTSSLYDKPTNYYPFIPRMLPPGKYNIVFYTMYWKTYIPFKIPTKNHNPQNMFAENL